MATEGWIKPILVYKQCVHAEDITDIISLGKCPEPVCYDMCIYY